MCSDRMNYMYNTIRNLFHRLQKTEIPVEMRLMLHDSGNWTCTGTVEVLVDNPALTEKPRSFTSSTCEFGYSDPIKIQKALLKTMNKYQRNYYPNPDEIKFVFGTLGVSKID